MSKTIQRDQRFVELGRDFALGATERQPRRSFRHFKDFRYGYLTVVAKDRVQKMRGYKNG